jgi:hypothetical protein
MSGLGVDLMWIRRARRGSVASVATPTSLRAFVLGSAALAVFATGARAQDFEAPAPAWPIGSACVLLERGLPASTPTPTLEGVVTRWHGLAALTTRAVSGALGWRSARLGVGLSQTGEPDVGWTALAMAVGAAGSNGGGALRAVARRDRTSPFRFDARGADVGVEIGGGAWISAATALHVWASAPQLWTRGAAPPLARPLEVGGALDLGDVVVWLGRAAVAGYPRGGRGEHTLGLFTGAGPLGVWLVARDQPLRGGLGVAARARVLRVAAEVESHPVLGETARMSLGLGGER